MFFFRTTYNCLPTYPVVRQTVRMYRHCAYFLELILQKKKITLFILGQLNVVYQHIRVYGKQFVKSSLCVLFGAYTTKEKILCLF